MVSVLEGNESITRTHELALGSAQERVGDAIETVVATLGKAIAASTGLQQKMVRPPPFSFLLCCLTFVGHVAVSRY